MNWRPIATKPDVPAPVTALIATRDELGEYFLKGIYQWKNGAWLDEDGDRPLPDGRQFFWVPEVEVIRDLVRSGVTA